MPDPGRKKSYSIRDGAGEVLRQIAEFKGYRIYQEDIVDSVTSCCPFCKRAWCPTDLEADSDYYGRGGLEYHLDTCPVYRARVLLRMKPYPDGVPCTICGKINWDIGNGWNGTPEEYYTFERQDLFDKLRDEGPLNKTVGGCCMDCTIKFYEIRSGWLRIWAAENPRRTRERGPRNGRVERNTGEDERGREDKQDS